MFNRIEPSFRIPRMVVEGRELTEGAGVRVRRFIGTSELDMVDPFLLFDVFGTGQGGGPDGAGFPPHPHRGLETVTYLLSGQVEHRDSEGHASVLRAGGVQWMTAGRGVIHSETPGQDHEPASGFQLWVNLPKANKMDPPRYQDFEEGDIPVERRGDHVAVRVISGTTERGTRGVVDQPLTEPRYFDVTLGAGAAFVEPVPNTHNAFVYVIAGALEFPGDDVSAQPLAAGDLATLSHGLEFRASARAENARFLLVSGRPLREPVARAGGFVMNTVAEIRAAEEEFRQGQWRN